MDVFVAVIKDNDGEAKVVIAIAVVTTAVEATA